jgi:flagellar motor protein MotB
VDFEEGKAAILPRHVPYLQNIASILAKAPGSKRIIVLGFADRTLFKDDPFGNWRLSAERALNVLRFFYNCHDCGYGDEIRDQLTLTGEGDIGASQTNITNAEDRRVDIIIDFGVRDAR